MTPSRRRIIIDTDAKNEADDQFAVVHALLSPSLDVRGIVAAHFGTRSPSSMLDSRAEVDLLLELMDRTGSVTVANGADRALPDPHTPLPSPGSRLIIDEALASDDRLFIAFLGPLTDMASALLEEPAIAERDIVVVWVGGPPYGDVVPVHWPEFNLGNDIHAANVVFDSDLTVWQVPMSVYSMVAVGYAELEARVRPCGRLGEYLVDQTVAFNEAHVPVAMELRSLGDSPAIGVVMNQWGAIWRDRPRPTFTPDGAMAPRSDRARTVRVCESVDVRWLLEDMFHKLEQGGFS